MRKERGGRKGEEERKKGWKMRKREEGFEEEGEGEVREWR